MTTHLRRSLDKPIRSHMASASFEERWRGPDHGLILCWEIGRQMRTEHADLAARAEGGELVPLPWKGGTQRVTDQEAASKPRFGTLEYLAMWQGLRNQDLDIRVDEDNVVCCAKTKIRVVFVRALPDENDLA